MKTKKNNSLEQVVSPATRGSRKLNGHKPASMELIKTFLYFAIFQHPLTEEEAQNFCQYPTPSIRRELDSLIRQKLLFKINDYYLPYNYPLWVERRINGGELAAKKMCKARKMANILTYFPFVRSVMISGSLSKGFMDHSSDIDFFVIMKPGSIAISKFLMGLFRRFFAPKSFCINFIIDSNNLHIKKQNLYTAIEMATLIPLIDDDLYDLFIRDNLEWIRGFLPNAQFQRSDIAPYKKRKFQGFLEYLLSTKPGMHLDDKLRLQYIKRLKRKADAGTQASGEIIINKGVIKLHGKPYQKKIMNLYDKYQENFFVERELVFNENFFK
ncbi:MAG TPA: hypothetical protein VKN36_03915 [Eudoraea sp.]|nr:hypothetical protein [Eudoraea sp.]